MDIQLVSVRAERVGAGAYRWVWDPRLAYGILPRTELKLRAPVAFRERSATPRRGLVGVGLGLFHGLNTETTWLPALALEGEVMASAGGASAAGSTYSGRAIATRTFAWGRIHANAGAGNYRVRVPGLGDPSAPNVPDAPCAVGVRRNSTDDPSNRREARALVAACMGATARPHEAVDRGGDRAFAGLAVDKALPLQSTLFVADVFVDRSGRPAASTEWTAEVGARRQLTPRSVVDVMVGRRETSGGSTWIVSVGATTTVSSRMLIPEAR